MFFQRQILKASVREHLFPAHSIRVQFWKFSLIFMVLLQFSSCSIFIALKIIKSLFQLHIVILMQASIKDLTSVTIHPGNKFAMDNEETKGTFFYKAYKSMEYHETWMGRSCLLLRAATNSSSSVTFFFFNLFSLMKGSFSRSIAQTSGIVHSFAFSEHTYF